MTRPAPLLAACLVLAAMAADPAHAASRAPPGPVVWTLSTPETPDQPVALVYAPFAGDWTALALRCQPKSGQVVAVFDVALAMGERRQGDTWLDSVGRPAPWPVSVVLASQTLTTTLRGAAAPNAKTGGSTVTVEASTLAPVIQEWRRTSLLRLAAAGENVAPPAPPKGLVSRFLRICR